MGTKVIAISREFGSGGRTIGKKVAEKLKIKCYDRELIQKLADESGFSKDYVAKQDDETPSYWYSPFIDDSILPNQEIIWNAQRNVILDLAHKESCVIVGRCADYFLKDKKDCYKIFIYADLEKRAKRVVEVYGENDENPEKRVKKKDKKRKAYHNYFTDNDWGDCNAYDICLNSGNLGIDRCVDLIVELYNS